MTESPTVKKGAVDLPFWSVIGRQSANPITEVNIDARAISQESENDNKYSDKKTNDLLLQKFEH